MIQDLSSLFIAFGVVERHAIQFQPVIEQLEYELAGDFRLSFRALLGCQFDHLAVAKIDAVVVVLSGHLAIARTTRPT